LEQHVKQGCHFKRLALFVAAGLILLGDAMTVRAAPSEPTNNEQLLIELVNRARHNPPKYATDFALSVPLTDAVPRPALAVNTALVGSARFHANEMATFNYFDHQSAVTGDWPNKMASDNGYPLPAGWEPNNNYIESIAAGTNITTPAQSLNLLLIDEGIDPPGHRIHLLAMHEFFETHDEIGAGYAYNAASTYRNYWAIHTARDDDARKFVTGVVYNDTATRDYFYTSGEGLAGVTVDALTPGTSNVVGTTSTFGSGGYSLKLANGAYDIRFSGGTLAQPIVHRAVQVGPANAKIDSLSLWNQNGSGNWGSPGNWLGGVPIGIGTVAVLQSKTAAARTVTVGAATVGHLKFHNQGGFSLIAPGTLDVDVAGGQASIAVVGDGSHSIRTDVNFHDDTSLSIGSGASLEFTLGAVQIEGKVLTKTGGGTLDVGGKMNAAAGSVLRTEGGVTNLNAAAGTPTSRTLSILVSGADTLVNFNSPQHLDSLMMTGGTVRLTPGGNNVLSLNSVTLAAPPPDAVVVPEPSSVRLLASILTVVAVACLRLRKRQAPRSMPGREATRAQSMLRLRNWRCT
jgi:uncharacterized protein YkwD